MSVTYNYGQLQAQIAYELGGRTDLLTIPSGSGLALSPIQQAIQVAIAKWEREHFYFNETGALQSVTSDRIVTETGSGFETEDGQSIIAESIPATGNFLTEDGSIITSETGSAIVGENTGSGGGGNSTRTLVMTTLSTVRGQEFYDSTTWPAMLTMPHVDKIWVFISGNRYSLNPRTEQYLSDTSLNPNVMGQPVDYAYYAQAMRLYPIPDGNYPITIEGTRRFDTLTAATDSNVWTTTAADLIKAEAMAYLLRNVLKAKELADDQINQIYGASPQEQGFIHALRSEGVQRPAVLKARAVYF